MPPTDTTERGLESLIVAHLTGQPSGASATGRAIGQEPEPYAAGPYILGDPADYDRVHAVDTRQLFAFLEATQPLAVEKLNLGAPGPSQEVFLNRLKGQIAARGVVDVLRKPLKHLSE